MRDLVLFLVLVSAPGFGADPKADESRCEVKVDQETLVLTGDAVSMLSDYWLTPQQLRESVNYYEPDPQKQEAAMKQDPVVRVLSLACIGRAFILNLNASEGTKYADVPMKPKTYKIGSSQTAGVFWGGIRIKGANEIEASSGTLTVTRFDKTVIEGTFSFSAEDSMGVASSANPLRAPAPDRKPKTVTGKFLVKREM